MIKNDLLLTLNKYIQHDLNYKFYFDKCISEINNKYNENFINKIYNSNFILDSVRLTINDNINDYYLYIYNKKKKIVVILKLN